jgi:tRNA threonylcarbamoyladenosine biosynthesis protein TsaB
MNQLHNNPILLINTALEEASVGIAVNGKLVDQLLNPIQKEHASFLHPAIQSICKNNGITLKDIMAVSVINGPGSYTGLRVGLSAAKGICYANQLPLLCINTLEWMAYGNQDQATDLIVPMIDARRMEVFTAVYNKNMEPLLPPTNLILDETSFADLLQSNTISFVGDGSTKWQIICQNANASFNPPMHNSQHHASLAFEFYLNNNFSELFGSTPFYTKEFYNTQNG